MATLKRRSYSQLKTLLSTTIQAHLDDVLQTYRQAARTLSANSGSPSDLVAAAKKQAEFRPLAALWERWRNQKQIVETTALLLADSDMEMRKFAMEETAQLTIEMASIEAEITALLLPRDVDDEGSAILELRAGANICSHEYHLNQDIGTGGQEAALFTAELLSMYERFAEKHRWSFELLDRSMDGAKAIKEAMVEVSGQGVFGRLKFESGVHRVQRVPMTDSQGRTHTSTATIAVLPIPQTADGSFTSKDIRIDVYRASGAGGQHVNKTNSAVRVVHLPTGITVTIQDERSQVQNKEKALKILNARLHQKRRDELEVARRSARHSQIGQGNRSDKIRTYNFPQGRLTDHRINVSLFDLDGIMEEGRGLDGLIDQLCIHHEVERLKSLEEKVSS